LGTTFFPDNPELSPKPEYRENLKRDAVFRQALPIPDKDIEKKIHHTFRIQYLKSSILPRGIDDNSFSSLNIIATHNQIIILTRLHQDDSFMKQLSVHISSSFDLLLVFFLPFLLLISSISSWPDSTCC